MSEGLQKGRKKKMCLPEIQGGIKGRWIGFAVRRERHDHRLVGLTRGLSQVERAMASESNDEEEALVLR
jgi:hypothetical protein